eukprot:scaffold1756_cov117-Isochrysis_galbana.AAC.7
MAPLQLRLEPTEVVSTTDSGAARVRVDSNDFLASHAAVISLSSKDSVGTIKLSRSAEGKDVVLQVSTGPRVSGAYSISSIQTVGEAETIPRQHDTKTYTLNTPTQAVVVHAARTPPLRYRRPE